MTFVDTCLNGLSIGAPENYRNMTLFALISSGDAPAAYLTLDEALQQDLAEISEISDGGHVPELRFINRADRAVLLLDGEELVGAKQNRVLNLSVLAPAGSEIVIPVSCVEAGRWNYRSRHFRTSNRVHFARGRAAKVASVSRRKGRDGASQSDQGQVWDAIASKQMRMSCMSETSAMSDLYDSFSGDLDGFVERFSPAAEQIGAVFAIGGEIVGLELFDSPATFRKLAPKILRSYALDAVEGEDAGTSPPDVADVRAWLDGLGTAQIRRFKAVGLGDDIRLQGGGYAGAALIATDGALPVHFCAFVS